MVVSTGTMATKSVLNAIMSCFRIRHYCFYKFMEHIFYLKTDKQSLKLLIQICSGNRDFINENVVENR
jgi:hypothetical protein